jgi:hypothetical protein
MRDDPRLYDVAKRITHDAGFAYTDPRTLETTQPRRKMNKIKKPAWVLFEQLHVNVDISTRMTVGDRAKLRKALNSASFKNAIVTAVRLWSPVPPIKPQVKVTITK